MQPTKALQETLYSEMLGRIKQTDLSVPSRLGDYLYYSRTEEGKQYPIMCRRKGSMDAPEELLLDLNALAEGHSYLGVGAYVVSDDGHWLAYSLDTTGYRQFTLHVKDLRTGQTSSEQIDRVGTCRVVERQSDTLLHDGRSGLEAIQQGLAARRRRIGQRIGVRGEGRVVRRCGEPLARPEDHLLRLVREDDLRAAVPCVRQPGRRVSGHSAQAGRARVRHGSLRRPAVHSHQQGSEELPGRQRAAGGSLGSQVDVLHRCQPRRKDREHDVLRPTRRRHRAGRRSVVPPGDRHENAGVAPHHDRGVGLRPRARRESRVLHRHGALRVPIDGDALVRVRLPDGYARADAAQTAGGPRRVRSDAVRSQARLGHFSGRHESADIARVSQRARARRSGASAAVRLRVVWHLHVAGVLVGPSQPARSRIHLRVGLRPRRRRARRRVARAGTDDAEDEHLHGLHRLCGLSRGERVHVARPAGDPGRQRRRSARSCGGQHAAGSLQGRGRAGAIRRRDEHDARCEPAAHDERIHRVGEPEREAGVRLHDRRIRPTTTSRHRPIRRCWSTCR